MSRLTWFKFDVTDYFAGRIQRQPFDVQGAFYRLCSVYWNKACLLAYEDACLECPDQIESLLKFKLIKKSEDFIRIDFLDEQHEVILDSSEMGRQSAFKRWHKNPLPKNKDLMGTHTQPIPTPIGTQCEPYADKIREDKNRIDEIRLDERIGKTRTQFLKPELSEVIQFFQEKKWGVQLSEWDHEKEGLAFYTYYESNGWKVGKNKMNNWKAAASGWITRIDQYKIQNNGKSAREKRDGEYDELKAASYAVMAAVESKIVR